MPNGMRLDVKDNLLIKNSEPSIFQSPGNCLNGPLKVWGALSWFPQDPVQKLKWIWDRENENCHETLTGEWKWISEKAPAPVKISWILSLAVCQFFKQPLSFQFVRALPRWTPESVLHHP